MQDVLRDGPMLVRALWGVSTSPPMPRYPEYVAAMQHIEAAAFERNPQGANLEGAVLAAARRLGGYAKADLPWQGQQAKWADMIAAVTSFTDDYTGPYPVEFFPPAETAALLSAINAAAKRESRPLSIVEQLELGLEMTNGSVFAAAVLLHATSRAIARGRDTRALSETSWRLEERIGLGRVFAAFQQADSQGGDPLGDTYHYWAMVVAGLWCADARHRQSVLAVATRTFLRNGADLMWLIRDRVFGSTLFFGRHKCIDRLGLTHGLALASTLPFALTDHIKVLSINGTF